MKKNTWSVKDYLHIGFMGFPKGGLCGIDVTYRCNLKCAHCYFRTQGYKDELSLNGWMEKFISLESKGFPFLICGWLGFDPKNASATTAFIVVFASLSGFFGHATLGNINWNLLIFSAIGSIAGALVGSWLMHRKLEAKQVKKIIGIVLYAIAIKMAWSVIF